MKKAVFLFFLLSLFACKKGENDNPIEYNNINGLWIGLDNLSLYTLSLNSENVKYGNLDKEFNYPIIKVNYSENTFEIYCKSYGFFQKLKKSSNRTIKIDINNSLDTITFQGIKYIRK